MQLLRSICPAGYQIRTIKYGKILVMLLYGKYYWRVYEVYNIYTVEPSIEDTIGNQHFVPYTNILRCPYNSGASGIFPPGVVLCNQAIEHNVAMFSELSFAVRWQGTLSRG